MEILIFQMGKVASTALAEALRRAGRSVVQAHIAAPDRLQQKFRIMTGPDVSDAVAQRMYEDYLQELRATYLLTRRRRADSSDKGYTRVISLTRDPLSWYWSHFAQNYDHYSTLLRRYHEYHRGAPDGFSPETALRDVQRAIFDALHDTRLAIDAADALPGLMAEVDSRDATNVVFSQLNRFLLPLRWFDEDFLPATGLDVYAHGFDRERGVGRIDVPGLSVLLLRYENLASLAGEVAEFAGLGGLELRLANVSGNKDIPLDLGTMRQWARGEMSPRLVDRIYATRYARHFGYAADAALVADGPAQAGR